MNSIFNQLLNVKGVVVETVRIVDSPLRPEPVLEVRVRPRRGHAPMLTAVADVVMVTTKVAACVVGVIGISAAGGSNWSP